MIHVSSFDDVDRDAVISLTDPTAEAGGRYHLELSHTRSVPGIAAVNYDYDEIDGWAWILRKQHCGEIHVFVREDQRRLYLGRDLVIRLMGVWKGCTDWPLFAYPRDEVGRKFYKSVGVKCRKSP